MKAATNQRFTILVTLGIGVLTLVYVFLVFLPGQRKISQQQQLLREQQDFVVQSTEFEAALAKTRAELESTRQFVERWQSSVPRDDQAAVVFGKLNRLARVAGVLVTRFEPQTPLRMQTIGRVDIALELQGPFSQVHDLFRELESLPETIWLQDLVIEEIQGNGGDIACEAILAVFTDRSEISD